MTITYYKIRNRETGLFRKADGSWNKSGKAYDTLGKLRTFLTIEMRYGGNYGRGIGTDWEIVEYTVVESAVKLPHEVMTPERLVEALTGERR